MNYEQDINIMKKGVLQLALQLNFWMKSNVCNSLYLLWRTPKLLATLKDEPKKGNNGKVRSSGHAP
jgi:hypothetical protein